MKILYFVSILSVLFNTITCENSDSDAIPTEGKFFYSEVYYDKEET